ncbi:MAG: DUF2281 domain-containing protein [Bacteroidetes bacterium]|nr:DUF2281 domain-containing protein [Bacteroidota bacterium]
MNAIVYYTKLNSLPDQLQKEAMDFIDFLFQKINPEKKNNIKSNKKMFPRFGSSKGLYKISPDFDEPLDDFNEYM